VLRVLNLCRGFELALLGHLELERLLDMPLLRSGRAE